MPLIETLTLLHTITEFAPDAYKLWQRVSGQADKNRSQQFVTWLTGYRVLTSRLELEYPKPCHDAVHDIRMRLQTDIQHISDADLRDVYKSLIDTCNDFLNGVSGFTQGTANILALPPLKQMQFANRLWSFRNYMHSHVALLGVMCGFQVPSDLISLEPLTPFPPRRPDGKFADPNLNSGS